MNPNHNRIHDLTHQQLGLDNITNYHRDLSWPRYYPSEDTLSIEFYNFWNWISAEYPAISYTSYTQQFFEEIHYTIPSELDIAVRNLLITIRFADLFYIDYTLLR